MSDGVPVVWLSPERAASEIAVRALAEWGRARGLRLVAPDEAGASMLRVDVSIGDRVEKELERARDAIAALDADAAERALARADALLRANPELPHAAWLRAEVERSWAARFSRVEPTDDARAAEAWRHAEALDGGRVAGIGESGVAPGKRVRATIVVQGAGASRVVVRLDGTPLTASDEGATGRRATYEADVAAAEHHLVAYADGQPVFASWIAIPEGAASTPIDVQLATGGACSRHAFSSVARDDDRVRAPGVACPRWVAAVAAERPGGAAAVLVARCERDVCGPLLEWRIERYGETGPPQLIARRTPWPAWATWTLLGGFAATATAVTIVATGVLERPPVEPRFVAGGARVE